MSLLNGLRRFVLSSCPVPILQRLRAIRYAQYLSGNWEQNEPDTAIVRHLVRPGGVALDLGANFGTYTKLLSELVGPTGRVFSVEPIPLTYELLRATVRQFRLSNVQTVNSAISSEDGEVVMEVPHYRGGGENLYEARIVSEEPGLGNQRRVRIPARALDSLFAAERDRIDFVKCDVEGHELNCLRGASELLAASNPAWLIEVSSNPDDPRSSAAALFALLGSHGYEAFRFDGQTLSRRQFGQRSVNYFFLLPEHYERVPESLRESCVAVA